jgi:hypothetical protein
MTRNARAPTCEQTERRDRSESEADAPHGAGSSNPAARRHRGERAPPCERGADETPGRDRSARAPPCVHRKSQTAPQAARSRLGCTNSTPIKFSRNLGLDARVQTTFLDTIYIYAHELSQIIRKQLENLIGMPRRRSFRFPHVDERSGATGEDMAGHAREQPDRTRSGPKPPRAARSEGTPPEPGEGRGAAHAAGKRRGTAEPRARRSPVWATQAELAAATPDAHKTSYMGKHRRLSIRGERVARRREAAGRYRPRNDVNVPNSRFRNRRRKKF